MYDFYAGHRNYFTGEPDEKPINTEWDYALLEAYQIIEDHTTEEGHLRWEAESDSVTFDAKRKINKARAAIERKTKGTEKKPYKAQDGEYWITTPRLMSGEWPTMDEWYEKEAKKLMSD